MPKELNRFLSSTDAAFLYLEKPSETMHIGGAMVYEGHISEEELIRLLEERLPEIPRYRQRVVFPPIGFSHPLWCDDPEFDIEEHIDVVELEGEVDDETWAAAAIAAYQGALPRDRPLWHATLIHGAEDGNTTIVWKIHHAMIDGVSGVDLTLAMNDLTPEPEPRPEPPEWTPEPLPDLVSLAQESARHRLTELANIWTDDLFGLLRPERMASRGRRLLSALSTTLPTTLRPAPKTPFNAPLQGDLGYAWVDFSFTEMRQIKSALGGTLNDLVLTVLAGGLARYMDELGEEIGDEPLRAMCPVSMRAAEQHGELGNLVSVMIAPLPLAERDPIERHARVRGGMDNLKEVGQAEALYDVSQISERVPPLLQAFASRLPFRNTLLNTVSTNVPGPQIPLFQGGRKLVKWLPMGIVSNNIGLFVAILSYNRRLVMGLTVDKTLVPDPWVVARCLEASQEEIREAAGVERFEEFGIENRLREEREARTAKKTKRKSSKAKAKTKSKSKSKAKAKTKTKTKTKTKKSAKRSSSSKKTKKKSPSKKKTTARARKKSSSNQSVA